MSEGVDGPRNDASRQNEEFFAGFGHANVISVCDGFWVPTPQAFGVR